jgi:hypothetical protein
MGLLEGTANPHCLSQGFPDPGNDASNVAGVRFTIAWPRRCGANL